MPPKSAVWEHFEKEPNNCAKCRHCGVKIKTSGNTTNLKNHLEHKHHKIGSKRPAQKDTEIVEAKQQKPSSSSSCAVSQPLINSALENVADHKEGGNLNFKITQSIVYMICKDLQPLSVVEHVGFRKVLKTTAPLFTMPTRKTIRTAILDKYDVVSSSFKVELNAVDKYCFTTDIWTDSNNRSFLSLTTHYLNVDQGCVVKGTIGIFQLTERHTSENIVKEIQNIFSEWGLEVEKTLAVISDNAANITKAVELMFGKGKHIPCFAHTLNLLATKAINDVPELTELLKKVKAIVGWFHHSTSACDELRRITNKTVVQDVPTRWNSTYNMLTRFIELRSCINEIINRNKSAPPMLSAAEMEALEEACQVLEPLSIATNDISSETYLTSSMAIPVASILKDSIEKLDPKNEMGKALKESVLAQHKKRFGLIEQVPLLALSCILDSRFKKMYFKDPTSLAKVINTVSTYIWEMKDEAPAQNESSDSDSSLSGAVSSSLFKIHNNKIQDVMSKSISHGVTSKVSGNSIPDEFSLYLRAPPERIQQNPILYWKHMAETFPVLSSVALKYVPSIATSVPSERLFSEAGQILRDQRSRLTADLANKLLFLKDVPDKFW